MTILQLRSGLQSVDCRYIESDPIGVQGGINTYTYTLNNPLRFSDSFGLARKPSCVIKYTIAGAAIGGQWEGTVPFSLNSDNISSN